MRHSEEQNYFKETINRSPWLLLVDATVKINVSSMLQ